MAEIQFDDQVDITDKVCPLTFVKAKVAIEELDDGEVLAIRMNDGEPVQNVPRSMKEEGCRMLIGIAAGWLWILFNKLKVNQIIALPIVGFVGSMVNTITVMGSIYLLFAQQYAQAKDVAISAVWGLVMGTVTASGIPEAIAAAVLVLAIGKVLIQVLKRMNFSFIDAQTAK